MTSWPPNYDIFIGTGDMSFFILLVSYVSKIVRKYVKVRYVEVCAPLH
jgi:hypothetical protein